jgi:tetratricopeptide (TPR) repeat protein
MTDVWSQQAAVLGRMGRHDEAFRAWQQVIRLNPEEASGPLGASAALVALGRLDEARAHAELAVGRSPAAAHQALATIAVAQRRFEAALGHAEEARKADPTLPLPAYVRGLIEYHQGRYEAALPHLRQARDAYAQRALQIPDLRFYIGDSLARLERYQEAEQFLREEVQIYPNSIRGRAGLAMLYQATGRPADAERAIGQMLAASPSPSAYDTAAQLWRMFGAPQRAAAVEAEARQRFRNLPIR